jgi:hypothetical protein
VYIGLLSNLYTQRMTEWVFTLEQDNPVPPENRLRERDAPAAGGRGVRRQNSRPSFRDTQGDTPTNKAPARAFARTGARRDCRRGYWIVTGPPQGMIFMGFEIVLWYVVVPSLM